MQNNVFTGRVAETPKQSAGDTPATRVTLINNEYAGKDKEDRVVSLQFSAFGGIGKAIAENVRKGDQLIVTHRIENNVWEKEGEKQYGHNFVILSFEFGAAGEETRNALANK